MLLAIFADIHANRQAFSACLDFARAHGAQRFVCLGDYVGYGADPEWTLETVMDLVNSGAMAVRGNHDNAVSSRSETMNAEAQAAIEWTRGRLNAAQRRFLAELPMTLQEDDRLYVHSEASNPAKWRYVQGTSDAARSLVATEAHVTLCGHIHQPALYSMSSTAKMTHRAVIGGAGAIAWRPALARRAGLGRAAARSQSGGIVCDARHRKPRDHLLPGAV